MAPPPGPNHRTLRECRVASLGAALRRWESGFATEPVSAGANASAEAGSSLVW